MSAEQANQSAESTGVQQSTSSSSSSIGYCHTCNRQVEIDLDTFTCKNCNNGFIELFELNDENSRGGEEQDEQAEPRQQQQQQQQQQRGGLGSPLVFRFGPGLGSNPTDNNNMGDLMSLIPMILPQLMNPAGLNVNTRTNLNPTGQRAPTQQNSFSFGQPTQQQQAPGGNRPTQTARFQFIIPGENNEQFDLYGVINNVISELLDPRRQGMIANNQFHFMVPPAMRMFELHGNVGDYAWGTSGLDTIITQLLNQLENTGPPPASEDQVKNLPVVVISQEDVEKNVQCAICMDDFRLNDEAKKLPCKHLFHESCISEWLKLHGTCPVCRKNLNGEDTSQNEYVRPASNNSNNNNNNENNSSESNTQTNSNASYNSSSYSNSNNTTTTTSNNSNINSNSSSQNRGQTTGQPSFFGSLFGSLLNPATQNRNNNASNENRNNSNSNTNNNNNNNNNANNNTNFYEPDFD